MNTIPRVTGHHRALRGGRWWIFSWLQIWPDGDSFVWASKKGATKYSLKCWCESLKVAVNTCHSETKQREMFFIHFHFSMMNVTGQWLSSWLFISGGWLSWWCPASSSSSRHFPKHIVIIIIICPETMIATWLSWLFSHPLIAAHTWVTLCSRLMSQYVTWVRCLIAS